MDREMIHRERDQLIDKYIRDELSDQERTIFEEHLLSCSECMNEIKERSRIIASLDKISAGETFQTKRNPAIWYIAAAAVAALVIGLFLLPNREHPSISSREAMQEPVVDTTEASGPLQDKNAGVNKPVEEDVQEVPGPQKRLAYLAEFQINPVYESQVGVFTRAGQLRVESPADSVVCHPGAYIEFKYQGAQSDSLYLVLLDNQGKILSEEKIASPYKFHLQFPAGLYYWQLCSEEESMHTAKIYIR
jgi:Putative zinc-finger